MHEMYEKDVVSQIMAYESGELDEQATTELFQYLLDTGLVWQLQGSYGRTAIVMIEAGAIQDQSESRNNG